MALFTGIPALSIQKTVNRQSLAHKPLLDRILRLETDKSPAAKGTIIR